MFNSKEYVAVMLVLTKMIEDKELNVNNALDFTMNILSVVQQTNVKNSLRLDDNQTVDLTTRFINEIAKGKDGKLGTEDDLIPPSTLAEILELLSSTMFSDLMVILNDLIKLRRLNVKRSLFCMSKLCLK